ncbi:MAG: ABC transporter ATP-binding protein [Rhodoblastus sp.]|jgi:NitT/TauT family transport system ATP-binding protein
MSQQISDPAIEFRGVSKIYGTGSDRHVVFENLSLTIGKDEFVAVVGGSGCGKTTLLNMAAGFSKPSAGHVLAHGVDVEGAGRDRGVVFQQYAVFPWLTVRENIEFPLNLQVCTLDQAAKAKVVEHYLEVTGLKRFESALPKALSGGMKQRVAIARAYAANPDILLMDEPFAALDAQSRENMQEALRTLTSVERKAAMFITHSVEEAIFLADRIVIMAGKPSKFAEIVTVPFDKKAGSELRLSDEFIAMRRHIEGQLKH